MRSKKQIVEEFLGKIKQRYPRCATTFFEANGDGFASVSLAVEGAHTLSLELDYDAPEYNGYDAVDIIDKTSGELLFQKTASYPGSSLTLGGLLDLAEKAFVIFVEHELGHAGIRIVTNQEEDAWLEKRMNFKR